MYFPDKSKKAKSADGDSARKLRKDLLKEIKLLKPGSRVTVLCTRTVKSLASITDPKGFDKLFNARLKVPAPDYGGCRLILRRVFEKLAGIDSIATSYRRTGDEANAKPRGAGRTTSANDDFRPRGRTAARSVYGSKSYWDARYGAPDAVVGENLRKGETNNEWYVGWRVLRPYALDYAARSHRVLLLGIGTSTLGEDMASDGFARVTAVDYSEPAVRLMRRTQQNRLAARARAAAARARAAAAPPAPRRRRRAAARPPPGTALVRQLDVLDHLRLRVDRTDTVPEQLVEHRLQRYRARRQHAHNHVHDGQRQFPDLQGVSRADRLRENFAKNHDERRRHAEPY